MRPQLGKKKLFTAAMQLFEAQGYFATSIEAIAAKAGVSKGLTYNYFATKEELLVALLDDATQRMAAVGATLREDTMPARSIEHFVTNYLEFLQEERRYLKLNLTLLLTPELKHIVAKAQKRRANLLLDLTTNWFTQAQAKLPGVQARLFLALLDGVALHYLAIYPERGAHRYPLADMREPLIDAAKRMCQPKT